MHHLMRLWPVSCILDTITRGLHFVPHSQALAKYMMRKSDDVTDLNALNYEGDAPIHAIVRHKRKKRERAALLLTLLVNGCSDVDINKYSEKSGDTALHLAVMVYYTLR